MSWLPRTFWALSLGASVFAGTWAIEAVANRDALREIVEDQCLVHWRQSHSPRPCERVIPSDSPQARNGYAILKDRKGGAHYLLIPTRRIVGIESPDLLDPAGPNYFDAAWTARDEVARSIGHAVSSNMIGMAVNSRRARSQDQLHIHIECLQPAIYAALQVHADELSDVWRPIPVPDWQLWAMRVPGETLGDRNPFQLVAKRPGNSASDIGDYSLLVAGLDTKAGPGFALLAGTRGGTERLLDSGCELVPR